MNKTLLNLLLFAIGLAILWMFTYPLYSGVNGLELLSRKSTLHYYARYKALRDTRQIAADLIQNGNTQISIYNNLPEFEKRRIDSAIAYPFDIARTINDINTLASSALLQMRDIRFTTPNPNQTGTIGGLSVYTITFTVEGSYSAFRDFIGQIENSLQLYTIKSISFTSANDLSGGIRFSVSLDTYEIK